MVYTSLILALSSGPVLGYVCEQPPIFSACYSGSRSSMPRQWIGSASLKRTIPDLKSLSASCPKSYLTMKVSALVTATTSVIGLVAAAFEDEVNDIFARPSFQNATIGVEVRDLSNGEIVFQHLPYRSLVPASNQKLATSAVTLKTLGGGFRYNTTVLATANADENGNIAGDIWLRGSGDPSLTSARLGDLAKEIADNGVKKVEGKVYGDGSAFDDQLLGSGWAWDDEPYYYSAQVDGLNCDLNIVNVTVTPGQAEGDAANILINGRDVEKDEYVKVESSVTTGGAEEISLGRLRGSNTITVSGSIPVDGEEVTDQVTIENPSSYTAYRFALALRNAGIEVSTEPASAKTVPKDAKELARSTSQPLSELLSLFMKPSDNTYGEALLKTVGYKENPDEAGSASLGVAVSQAFYEEAEISYSGVETVDGSGLSRMDTVTTTFLCDLLVHVYSSFSETDKSIYLDALPVGGVDGTLENRFQGTPLEGNIRAKTGSLTGVSALSGYLTAKREKDYVLSILMNHASDSTEAREAQDDIALALYNI